jgi:hypothetical protein
VIDLIRKNKYNLLLLVILVFVLLIFYHPVLAELGRARSSDSLEHLAAIKKISSEETFKNGERYFWGTINTAYPPLTQALVVSLQKIIGFSDIKFAANFYVILVLVLLFLSYYVLLKVLFKSDKLSLLGLVLLAVSYYPMIRYAMFLPENLAILVLMVLLILFARERINRPAVIAGVAILVGLTGWINPLTTTIVISAMLFFVPIKFWQRKYAEGSGLLVSLILGTAFSVSYYIFFSPDNIFWINFLKKPAIFSAAVLFLIFVYQLLMIKFSRNKTSFFLLIVFCVFLVVLTFNILVGSASFVTAFLSDRYWPVNQFFTRIHVNLSGYFFQNGHTRLGLNPLVGLVSGIGIIMLCKEGKIFSNKYGLIAIIILLSFVTALIGPYFGIDPSDNAPRSMLYLSLMAPIVAVFAFNQFHQKRIFGFGLLAFFCVILLTSLPNTVSFLQNKSISQVPKSISGYLSENLTSKDLILTDQVTLYSIYIDSDRDLTYLFYTPQIHFDTLITWPDKTTLSNNKVKYLIVSPGFEYFQEELSNADQYQLVFQEGNYKIYRII